MSDLGDPGYDAVQEASQDEFNRRQLRRAEAAFSNPAVSEFDVCVIHLSTRAVEEDPSVCWKYEGTDDCRFTTTHPMTSPAVLPCPECEGSGEIWPLGEDSEPGDWYPCPSCSGSGVVPSPEAVEAAARAIWRAPDRYPGELPYDQARAALGEFLRLNREGK